MKTLFLPSSQRFNKSNLLNLFARLHLKPWDFPLLVTHDERGSGDLVRWTYKCWSDGDNITIDSQIINNNQISE